jgi:hypothetical protein
MMLRRRFQVSKRLLVSLSAVPFTIALVSLATVQVAGQAAASAARHTTAAAKKWTPPRTSDGRPDLQGTWNFATITPFERPNELAGKEVLTDEDIVKAERAAAERLIDRAPRAGDTGSYNRFWIDQTAKVFGTRQTSQLVDPPDGKLPPYTPEGEKRQAALAEARKRSAGPEDRSPGDRCILGFNAGPPIQPGPYNNLVQLFQTPGHVVLLTEMVHTARIVPTDGRSHGTIRQWSGDSRARWEGDTLVIDTINFRDDGVGALNQRLQGTDKNLHVVERFTRIDADTLLYEFTVEDPTVWTKPWTVSTPMRKTEDRMFEFACHEGNYAMTGILAGTRAAEKAAEEARKKGSR